MTKFFMVWREKGRDNPTKKHPTVVEANEEAARLAAKYPEENFWVLVNLDVCHAAVEVKWGEKMEPNSNIKFPPKDQEQRYC